MLLCISTFSATFSHRHEEHIYAHRKYVIRIGSIESRCFALDSCCRFCCIHRKRLYYTFATLKMYRVTWQIQFNSFRIYIQYVFTCARRRRLFAFHVASTFRIIVARFYLCVARDGRAECSSRHDICNIRMHLPLKPICSGASTFFTVQ